MGSCKTCKVEVKDRPGKCMELECPRKDRRMRNVSGEDKIITSWNYPGYLPIEEEKTCGNCGWHGDHGITTGPKIVGTKYAVCPKLDCLSVRITGDNLFAGQLVGCHWKPIKPICEVCGGTGKVCKDCGKPPTTCTMGARKPCPKCQGEKGETSW